MAKSLLAPSHPRPQVLDQVKIAFQARLIGNLYPGVITDDRVRREALASLGRTPRSEANKARAESQTGGTRQRLFG